MKDISIEYMSIKDLKPYKKNPRKNDSAVDAVAESIKNFGFKNPIVIDASGEIINGHTRLKAAKKLHLETVPVIRADDLTPEQVKACEEINQLRHKNSDSKRLKKQRGVKTVNGY